MCVSTENGCDKMANTTICFVFMACAGSCTYAISCGAVTLKNSLQMPHDDTATGGKIAEHHFNESDGRRWPTNNNQHHF